MNTNIKIKICGITNLKDAFTAVYSGADALGFIFADSPRKVTPAEAKKISDSLPPYFTRIGVFANTSPAEINKIAEECSLDAVQLHGNESAEDCRKIKKRIIKTIIIEDLGSLDKIAEYEDIVSAFLFDTFSPDKLGGTGETFNWDILADLNKKVNKPIILAGGLNIDNIEKAIKTVNPYGVDLNSGVETEPGQKDHDKIREIIAKIRS
jgi:phosphoribosylanthranilate isomerase